MTFNLDKYNKPTPRYTSYPPVPYWRGAPPKEEWIKNITKYQQQDGGIDLYIHIPYCQQLCWYCGCHRHIKKDQKYDDAYVELILQEWNLYLNFIKNLKIKSLHFGGGTPNYLRANVFKSLMENLSSSFHESVTCSIELDPRTLTNEFISVMANYPFKRISMGIQDFDPKVQKAINRIQSKELITKVMVKLKAIKVESINFDLIYGLPHQNLKSIEQTLKDVKDLSPDLIAFYSYAHLPEKLKNQKLINYKDLLQGKDKYALFLRAREVLLREGYISIGLDHFAKVGSYLADASRRGRVLRNFMGHTDKKENCLLGLGVSAISESPDFFWQNEKDLHLYERSLINGPRANQGHVLSKKEKIISKEIQSLMCHEVFSLASFSEADRKIILRNLHSLIIDGLITGDGSDFKLTDLGRDFRRNVAQCLDLGEDTGSSRRFSSAV